MKKFKIAALCGALLAFCMPFAVWGGDELTKGEILDILLSSAPDYTSYISAEDIVSGYNEGDFREDKLAEDIEMLVMISRAFPFMEEPKGVNLAELPQKAEERELPYWAQKHYDYLNKRGIITSNTVLDDSVTREELLAFYEGKLAKWQIPDDVVFVDAIPLGATGKMLKTKLREVLVGYQLPDLR